MDQKLKGATQGQGEEQSNEELPLNEQKDYKIILDSPSETPALGFSDTARALREIIESSKPQFVVGIFGKWGSGKTTLMREIQRQLDKSKSIPLEFSAWRYEKEPNLIIPLLDIVRKGLIDWADENRAIRQNAVATASVIGKAIYALLAGLSFKIGVPGALELSYKANEALAKAEGLDEKDTEARVPRSFYHSAFRALAESFKGFIHAGGPDRIVVFVDDLDRCLPQGALDVLEAMKLFFDLEGFIFVVGLDQSVVERSIDLKYHTDSSSGSATDETVNQFRGSDYVKKIFQLPFSVAPVAITQLDEFLNAIYLESQLPRSQITDFQDNVIAHLRYIVAEADVNPREVKRFLNSYTLGIKVKPHLDRGVMLALQTVAFRRDWRTAQKGILGYREIFTQALQSRVSGNAAAITDLDPELAGIPDSFISYVSTPNPGSVLLSAQNLDEHIYSGEATRSSQSPIFLDAIRDVAAIRGQLRQLQSAPVSDSSQFQTYSSQVSTAESRAMQAVGPRFSALFNEWKNHLSTFGSSSQDDQARTQWFLVEEAFIARALNQLTDLYRAGSAASAPTA